MLNKAIERRFESRSREAGRIRTREDLTLAEQRQAEALADELASMIHAQVPKIEVGHFPPDSERLALALVWALSAKRHRGEAMLNLRAVRRHLEINECLRLAMREDLSWHAQAPLRGLLAEMGWNGGASAPYGAGPLKKAFGGVIGRLCGHPGGPPDFEHRYNHAKAALLRAIDAGVSHA